jgi:hypothetical protein
MNGSSVSGRGGAPDRSGGAPRKPERENLLSRIARQFSRYRNRQVARTELLHRMPKHAVCAEIGVWRGNYSQQILAVTEPAELHLVDPWLFMPHLPLRGYGGRTAKDQGYMDGMARQVGEMFARDARVTIHRMRSDEFFRAPHPKQFDWIYIDGDHRYEAVLADLRGAWPLVKSGGFLAGDDFLFNKVEERDMPVKRAVEQFAREIGARLELVGKQFYFRKP